MAAIVYQINRKTGVTYAYESISFWDKDKQQSRAKRRCIGRIDPETKEIGSGVYSDYRFLVHKEFTSKDLPSNAVSRCSRIRCKDGEPQG